MINRSKKTTWNYRLFEESTGGYTIRAIYYTDNIPHSYGDTPEYPTGDNIEEVTDDLKRMLKCLKKPSLAEKDFK